MVDVNDRSRRHRMLGLYVNALTRDDLMDLFRQAINECGKLVIGNLNLHSTYLYHHDPEMRRFYDRADFVYIDGMPLVWFGRLLGLPLRRCHRVTFLDVIHPFMEEAARSGWRIYVLGSRPGVAEKAAGVLRSRYPGLVMMTRHGYFDHRAGSRDNQEIIAEIIAFQPDVVLVGLGQPLQERWIRSHAPQLNVSVVTVVGALFDYIAGEIPTPPRWMGRLGFEWLYRLVSEPRRLGKRYLIEPWFAVRLFTREWSASKFQRATRRS